MQLREVSVGSAFWYAGREWILLDRRGDRHLCIHAAGEGPRQFDRGMQARFNESAAGAWLNGEYYEALLQCGASAADFTPLVLNLANSGIGDVVYALHVGLLSWRQWLHYAGSIRPVWAWQWTCSLSEGKFGTGLRCMAGSGANGYAYYPPNHPDPIIRPALSLLSGTIVEQ